MSSNIDINAYENAWLGLDEDDLKSIRKPLSNLSDKEKNDFHLYVLKKMRDPENDDFGLCPSEAIKGSPTSVIHQISSGVQHRLTRSF